VFDEREENNFLVQTVKEFKNQGLEKSKIHGIKPPYCPSSLTWVCLRLVLFVKLHLVKEIKIQVY